MIRKIKTVLGYERAMIKLGKMFTKSKIKVKDTKETEELIKAVHTYEKAHNYERIKPQYFMTDIDHFHM